MSNKPIKTNVKQFVGKAPEQGELARIADSKQASIIVIHGRRRVGKTSLIERAFKNRQILKIEGVENGGKAQQIETALIMLSQQLKDPVIARLRFTRWWAILTLAAYTIRWLIPGRQPQQRVLQR